jgi:hypothetical protein
MLRRERSEPSTCLLELALAACSVAATGLVPGDDDVDEALEEVLLGRVGRPPGVLERLVRGEVLACAGELQAPLEVTLYFRARLQPGSGSITILTSPSSTVTS